MGIVQKGRSRLWYDDHDWWAGLIEFQSSSRSRGSYLNVGVQWLWDIEWDSLDAFMYPGGGGYETRVLIPGEGQFIAYESDDQFAPLALKIANAAADRARYFRDLFPSVDAAARVLAQCEGVDWDIEAGVASGLTGDYKSARQRFDHYLEWDESKDGQAWRGEWMDARADRVRALRACVDDTERFSAMIAEDIRTVRAAAKLDPDVPLPF
ncbi:MAG TPA: hypothetical protein VJL85_04035 [Gaiellaceae bacterium]|jgi:hypothetical protein|nr:hypothetical protein [Gaiellaceae bacterium]